MGAPSSCDVLIAGAGPAGSAAACALAAGGHDVLIADGRLFPRDKVCGDGLISDALGALRTLGLDTVVRREAWSGGELRVYAPGGAHVALRGEFACLPRERLDAILLDAAVQAGSRFLHGTVVAPVVDEGVVSGARIRADGDDVVVRARVTILATGANTTALAAFGMLANGEKKPDAVAGRAYYEVPDAVAAELGHLSIVYDRDWCPGYGWIFPGPGNRFNVGVGLFGRDAEHGRLRQFFEVFCRTFPPAARLVSASRLVRDFRGAPIRSGLTVDVFGRPGLLAVGETIGTTYSATGEGIGKAMETGLLAGQLVRDVLGGRLRIETLESAYRAELQGRFLGRYRAYRLAQRWAGHPAMLNLLAHRANRGTFVRQELEALVAERGDVALFSARGLLRALIR